MLTTLRWGKGLDNEDEYGAEGGGIVENIDEDKRGGYQ
jgi:hypothetical protein